MRTLILGFAAGAAWLQTQASLPPHAGALLWVIAGAGLMASLALRRYARWRAGWCSGLHSAVALAAGVGLGFYWAAWLAQAAMAPQLALADEGQDILVTGTIASLPYRFEQGVRFNFAVEKAVGAKVPPLIALSWYAGFRDAVTNEVGDVQPGERWRLTVRLQRPHGNANPMGFDYEAWLLEQGVRATGYVRPQPRADTQNVRLALAMWWRRAARRCARASCAAWTENSTRA